MTLVRISFYVAALLMMFIPNFSQAVNFYPFIGEIPGAVSDDSNDGFYFLDKIQAQEAWSFTPGSKNVLVGLIDTGVNYNLDVLKSNIAVNMAEIPNNQMDDDGNGYVDDVYGVNTYDHTSDPMDFNGHGTSVASLVGAMNTGVAKEVSLVLARSLSDEGYGTHANVLEAINYVISRGSRIVGVTLGGGISQALCLAMEEAKAKNVLFIVVAGNAGTDLDKDTSNTFPWKCTNDNKIIVGSSDQNDFLSWYSNYGANTVDVLAPGASITNYDQLGRLRQLSGTSFSVAITTGIAALALAANPSLTYQELKDVIFYGTDTIVALNDTIKSSGRVNAYKTVRLARSIPHP